LNPKVYWLTKSFPRQLGISSRPRGGDWLEDEVEGWRKQGVDVVVSLLTKSENEELGLEREAGIVIEKGIQFYSLPIEDRGVPTSVSSMENFIAQLSSQIQQGKKIAIHCRQGIGRSSLVSAALLIHAGENLEQSLKTIREARGVDVPETSEQRDWLNQFAKAHVPDLARQHH